MEKIQAENSVLLLQKIKGFKKNYFFPVEAYMFELKIKNEYRRWEGCEKEIVLEFENWTYNQFCNYADILATLECAYQNFMKEYNSYRNSFLKRSTKKICLCARKFNDTCGDLISKFTVNEIHSFSIPQIQIVEVVCRVYNLVGAKMASLNIFNYKKGMYLDKIAWAIITFTENKYYEN